MGELSNQMSCNCDKLGRLYENESRMRQFYVNKLVKVNNKTERYLNVIKFLEREIDKLKTCYNCLFFSERKSCGITKQFKCKHSIEKNKEVNITETFWESKED